MTLMQPRDLTGTVVAITGGSAGIGRATAEALVAAGAHVVVGARRLERLTELAEQLGSDRVVPVQMDVREPADNARLVQAALDTWGRLDSVVANVGIGSYGSVLHGSDEDVRTMIDTNVTGTVFTVRAALPPMLAAGAGDVVIVGSVAGFRSGPDEAVYAATKFAQQGFAGGIDRELREKGIRVTTINPAGVETEFAIGRGRTEGDPSLADYLRPEMVAHAIVTTLQQPREMRTQTWAMWSMGQGS
ncbi:SDR family oxidoreductase [Cellulomonas phragmiteti]|nr:SDR family oxidoreductase [Cellulomonas phragmiteti]